MFQVQSTGSLRIASQHKLLIALLRKICLFRDKGVRVCLLNRNIVSKTYVLFDEATTAIPRQSD